MRIDGPQLTSSLSLNGTTITDLNVFATTASVNSLTGSMATTGSNLFKGTQTISGSILPAVNNIYDLGSPTFQFRHVYISTGSLYIDGTKVLGSTSQELQITTDVGQSFKILETGSDSITLQSVDGNITLTNSGGGDVVLDPNTGVIQLKGPTTIYAGYKFLSSDGNAIQFGNGIAVTGSIVSTVTPLVSGSSQISYTGLSNIPSGIVSSSSQISYAGITNVPSGIVSGSSQISYTGLSNIPSGIVSGSSQLTSSYDSRYVLSGSITQTTWDNIANKPVGITSGSSQIDITGTTGYSTFSSSISNSINTLSGSIATTTLGTKNRVDSIESKTGSYATTGSNSFNGNQTITGSSTVTGDLTVQGNLIAKQFIISSSVSYLTTSFSSGSTKFGDSSDDTHQFTGSVNITGSLNISGSIISTVTSLVSGSNQISYTGITNIPSGIISGSAQLPSGIVSSSAQTIANLPSGTVSGSSQVIYSGLTGIPSGIVSSSAQTIANLPAGTVSGSSQVLSGTGIFSGSAQLPSGIVSSSAQTIANLPSGTVSGSSQVIYSGLTGIPSGIISGSAQLPSGIVSGSVQIINLGFATTSSVITASSVRNVDTFTATANQSTFTSSQGYSVGLIDVFVNGSKLAASDYVALNGTSVLLNVAAEGGETVELYAYFQALNSNNALRTVTTATATASQTVFTGITYTQGLIEVYYNGSRLSSSEYTATNGTSVTLSTAANVGDILDFIAYNYTVGAFVGLSGTGTANYLPKYASTSSLTNSSIIDNSGAVTINGTLVVTGTTLVSGSSQISYTGLSNIPSGIISGSVQVDVMSTTNIARLATTGSNVFTGTLAGTSATFSSTVQSTGVLTSGNVGATTGQFIIESGANAASRRWKLLTSQNVNGDFIIQQSTTQTGSTFADILGFNATGLATFSNSVQSNTNFISNITTDTPSVGTTTANNATYNYLGYSGYWGLRTTSTGYNFALDTYNGGTPKNVLTVTQTGAATFTGPTVTIGSAVAATNVKLLLNGVASKAAGIEFQQSGTAQWYLGNGIASEDNNFELYNSNGTMAMKIIKSTNAINFIGSITATVSSGNNLVIEKPGGGAIAFTKSATNSLLLEDDGGKAGFYTWNGSTWVLGPTLSSSGIKFGNGSSNLNYYEEGTFTPSSVGTSFSSISVVHGKYVRIGNQVTVNCKWTVTPGGTGRNYVVFNLPFAFVITTSNGFTGAVSNYNEGFSSSYSSNVGTTVRNSSGSDTQQYVEAVYISTNAGSSLQLMMTYFTF
jgi:hypothetical protein